jgi:dihydrofolate reductase
MKIIAIAAMTRNRIIAVCGQMPWQCSPDMKFFKETTTGYPVIVGRQTLEDMGGHPLPNRHTIILTRKQHYAAFGNSDVASNVREAISKAYRYCELNNLDRCYVIGGEQVYKAFELYIDKMLLSVINGDYLDDELLLMANSGGKALKINYMPHEILNKDNVEYRYYE